MPFVDNPVASYGQELREPTLWARIDALRKSVGLTVAQLAERAGISEPGYYSRKKGGTLEVVTLEAMAKVFGVPPGVLLDGLPRDASSGAVAEPAPTYALAGDLAQRVAALERVLNDMRRALAVKP